MVANPEPYNGADRRRVGRDADESCGWVLVASALIVVAAVAAVLTVTLGGTVPASLGDGTLSGLLQAAAATGAVLIGALMIKRAILTGEAAPRLIGVGVLVLALVVVAGLPTVLAGASPLLAFVLRAGGMVAAATLLLLAARWPTVDAGLRSREVVAGGVAAFVCTLLVVAAALSLAPASWVQAAVDALVMVGILGIGVGLLWHAHARRRRLFAAGGLLVLAWTLAQLPALGTGGEFATVSVVLDSMRLLAVAVGVVVALDDLQAAFVAQRGELLRTELDRRSVEARLQAHREQDAERAHEARSALTAIEGASNMLARYRAGLDEDGRVALSSAIQAEIERLQRLVDASHVAEPEPLALARLVEGEVALAVHHGSDVHVHVPDDLWVFAERDAVLGILRNLLVNARTHAPGAAVWISATPAGAAVELRVTDDGPGMSPEDRARAFDRGHRGEGAAGRPGSGLGLHVARGLAVRNGGTLEAETREGQGAAFVLRLPSAARGGDLAQPVDQLREVGELDGVDLT